MAVVLYHTSPRFEATGAGFSLVNYALDLGYSAVNLFFVLSGFILATVYSDLADPASRARFLIARLARVYPLYALSLLIDLPRLLVWRVMKYGLVGGCAASATTLIAQLLFLQAWVPSAGSLNHPSWSVATEAFFYLLFPLLLPAVRHAILRLGLTATLVALLVLNAAPALVASLLPSAQLLEAGVFHNPIVRLPEFVAGIVLANVRLEIEKRETKLCWLSTSISMFGVLGLLFVVWFSAQWNSRVFVGALLGPLFCAIILGSTLATSWVAAALSLPFLVLLGEASYAVYLLHVPVWNAFGALGRGQAPGEYVAYLFVTVGVSVAAYILIERPARIWIVRWWDRRSARLHSRVTTVAQPGELSL
jgi:peptidoglycan/LPS O-acetylase OafA/YrhL